MTRPLPRVAILGGGMAGVSTAWRLSEPGWQDNFDAITVFQRGWLLGGKGASTRGVHGRIEEHGLHIWLGYYENAFRMLRECYAELDRERTDPGAPIRAWTDAMVPAPRVGLQEHNQGTWEQWLAHFSSNDAVPGEPNAAGGVMSVVEFMERSIRLLRDFADSLPAGSNRVTVSRSPDAPAPTGERLTAQARAFTLAAVLEALTLTQSLGLSAIDRPLADLRAALLAEADCDAGMRRAWHLISVIVATIRGILTDGLLTDPKGFRRINDEDYRAWILRHGGAPEAVDSTLVGGLYDLVFAHQDGDPTRASFGAGWGVFLSGKTFFDYKGSIFWKMCAGMGDVVFAPLYEVLSRRGVEFEFFNRVDELVLSDDHLAVDSVLLTVEADLATGVEGYEPLIRVKGLPCFPAAPLTDQLAVERSGRRRVLRRNADFDVLVFAMSLGTATTVCHQLIDDRPKWREMVQHVRTVATQAFQLWLREDEPALRAGEPGRTITGFVKPFDTWASMAQTLEAEDWPDDDRPRAVAYFCGTLATPIEAPNGYRDVVRDNAVQFLSQDGGHLLPGTMQDGAFRWDLLCGRDGVEGPDAFATQFWSANVDPSDRYVQSVAGSDRYRLRPDESGYDNLYLAGDWTDCGLNAGCIEAAVLSGLRAANAVMGRSRHYRIAGRYLD